MEWSMGFLEINTQDLDHKFYFIAREDRIIQCKDMIFY